MPRALKALARRVRAARGLAAARRDAKRAFAYDLRRFLENAGPLHPGRGAAALAGVVMGYHVLEKGLTMPRRRVPFGAGAALRLARAVEDYERTFGRTGAQALHAESVLLAWREANAAAGGAAGGEAAAALAAADAFFATRPGVVPAKEPHVSRDAFFADRDAPFPRFAASRHCVRHFAGPVPRETVERAVAIAATAPSACNRQPVRVHVVDDPALRDALLALQGGTRGFGEDADKLLVVTADVSTVRWVWERNDAHVNAGVFAMNLAYALHHLGVAHCLLHWSVEPAKDAAARRLLGLPDAETIALVLACGLPPPEFDVAASPRLSPADVLTWHGGPA